MKRYSQNRMEEMRQNSKIPGPTLSCLLFCHPRKSQIMKIISKKSRGCLTITCLLIATSILMILMYSNVKSDVWRRSWTDISPYIGTRDVNVLEKAIVEPTQTPTSTRHPLIPVYPYHYKFILNQPDKCKEETPFLVLLIVTQANDIAARCTIRKTWGNENAIPGLAIKRLFLIGMDPHFTAPVQNMLQEESLVFQDIVQQDFLDSYHNLTLKTMMGMEWVTRYCQNASYVLKIDTDVFLNVDFLVHDLLKTDVTPRKDYFTGRILANTGPIRDKVYKKWYIPKEVYSNEKYPSYCAGPSYVFSGDLAKKIYDVAQLIPSFPMEDTFVGLCLQELGIQITNPPDNVFHGYGMQYDRCKFYKLACVHPFSSEELLRIWPDFLPKNDTACPK